MLAHLPPDCNMRINSETNSNSVFLVLVIAKSDLLVSSLSMLPANGGLARHSVYLSVSLLLDERLSYHSYLASDTMFASMEGIEVADNEGDRPDLFILNNAFAFSEEKDAPYQAISIVEFKKPERNNYVDNDEKKNPLDQVEQYVDDLINGKVRNRKGRTITITKETPFYIYIVCDLTPTLVKILERRDFMKTPDGLGYYNFKNKRYNGFVIVLSYEKVKADARKRNQILFDKLGLPEGEMPEL